MTIIEKRYNLNAKLEPSQYALFKSECALQNITISELISVFISDFSKSVIKYSDGKWIVSNLAEQ